MHNNNFYHQLSYVCNYLSHSGKAPKLLLPKLKKTPTKMASTHSKQAQLSPSVWDLYNQLIHPPSPLDNSLGAYFKPTPSIQDSELALPIVKHLNVLSFKNLRPSVSDFWPSFLWLPWWVCMIWFGPCSSLPVFILLFHGSLHPEGHFERESISNKKSY